MKPLSDSEVVAIVRDRVGSQLPDAPHTVIGEEVAKSLQAYADCKVRDFVPILVERETVARLRTRGPESASPPSPDTTHGNVPAQGKHAASA